MHHHCDRELPPVPIHACHLSSCREFKPCVFTVSFTPRTATCARLAPTFAPTPPHNPDPRRGAGNFFFAGARMFFRSLDAAIFLFSRVARLPLGSAVVPAISTEERITLGAELADGSRLRGQNVISHPPAPSTSQLVEKDCAPPSPAPHAPSTFYSANDTMVI